MRSTFEVHGQYVTHRGCDPFTGDKFQRCYWVPHAGGYVRLDTSRDGRYPGTLGAQPHTDGATWAAQDVPDLLRLIKSEWRKEQRAAKCALER